MTMGRRAWSFVMSSAALMTLAACQAPNSQSANGGLSQWAQADRAKAKPASGAAALEPDVLPRTHYAAGRLHESQNQINRAVEQYQAAVSIDPNYVDALNGLGVCQTRLGNYRQAEEQFIKAIRIAPDKAHLRNNLAFCYISQRRWADAEAELRNALELKPDFVRAQINLALALAQQSKFDAALQAFRAVLTEGDAQFNIGLMYQSVGRYADAGNAYRAALEKNPRLVAAKERLEKLQPFLDRAQRDVAAREAQALVPTTRPSGAVASVDRRKSGAAPVVAAEKGLARQKEGSRQTELQASPVPRVPVDVLPSARQGIVSLTRSLAHVAAAGVAAIIPARAKDASYEWPKPFVVTCDATAEPCAPEGLDVQDDQWLGGLDPGSAAGAAQRLSELEEGVESHRDAATPALQMQPSEPDRVRALPVGPALPGNSILIGAMLMPDDPYRAFPRR